MSTLGDDWKHRYYRKLKQTIRFCLRLQAAEERIAALEAELSSAQKLFGQANDQANRYGKLLQEALSELERRNQQLQNAEFCLQRTESDRDSFRELAERYQRAFGRLELVEEVVRKWKFFWMAQTDGSYRERAFGIDSNMMHDLAQRLSDYALASHPPDPGWGVCSKCEMTIPLNERCHMCAEETERDALKRLEAAAREVVRHNPCACFSGNPCAIHAALDALDEARKK